MGKNAEFVVRMEKQMTRWDKEVAALAKLGGKATDNAKVAFLAAQMDMRAARDTAEKTFQEARFASEESGARLQVGMQEAWVKMQETLAKATAELNKS
jgi:hypothetical protein